MNIKARLEAEHSKQLTLEIVSYIGGDSKKFNKLMTVFLSNDQRLSQRAAWPLSFVVHQHPLLIQPYFASLMAMLNNNALHPAVHRNILRTFEEIEIPENFQAELLDACLKFITASHYPLAVRAFAITVATNISSQHPELANELQLILTELTLYPQAPAIRVRVKRALKELVGVKK